MRVARRSWAPRAVHAGGLTARRLDPHIARSAVEGVVLLAEHQWLAASVALVVHDDIEVAR
jgi:hypothetical protein